MYEHFTSCLKKLNGILSRAEHTHDRTDIILSVTTSYYVCFPSSSAVKNPPALQKTWVPSWIRKILWRRKWQLIPVFLSGKFHGRRVLAGYSPWRYKRIGWVSDWVTNIFTFTPYYTKDKQWFNWSQCILIE